MDSDVFRAIGQAQQSRRNVSKIHPQHEISDRVRSEFFIDGEWKAPSGSADLDLISPNTEELFLRVPEACPELKVSHVRRRPLVNGLMKGPFV
jgi:hypothetical protein